MNFNEACDISVLLHQEYNQDFNFLDAPVKNQKRKYDKIGTSTPIPNLKEKITKILNEVFEQICYQITYQKMNSLDSREKFIHHKKYQELNKKIKDQELSTIGTMNESSKMAAVMEIAELVKQQKVGDRNQILYLFLHTLLNSPIATDLKLSLATGRGKIIHPKNTKDNRRTNAHSFVIIEGKEDQERLIVDAENKTVWNEEEILNFPIIHINFIIKTSRIYATFKDGSVKTFSLNWKEDIEISISDQEIKNYKFKKK